MRLVSMNPTEGLRLTAAELPHQPLDPEDATRRRVTFDLL
jgi:hypothetical protein